MRSVKRLLQYLMCTIITVFTVHIVMNATKFKDTSYKNKQTRNRISLTLFDNSTNVNVIENLTELLET